MVAEQMAGMIREYAFGCGWMCLSEMKVGGSVMLRLWKDGCGFVNVFCGKPPKSVGIDQIRYFRVRLEAGWDALHVLRAKLAAGLSYYNQARVPMCGGGCKIK